MLGLICGRSGGDRAQLPLTLGAGSGQGSWHQALCGGEGTTAAAAPSAVRLCRYREADRGMAAREGGGWWIWPGASGCWEGMARGLEGAGGLGMTRVPGFTCRASRAGLRVPGRGARCVAGESVRQGKGGCSRWQGALELHRVQVHDRGCVLHGVLLPLPLPASTKLTHALNPLSPHTCLEIFRGSAGSVSLLALQRCWSGFVALQRCQPRSSLCLCSSCAQPAQFSNQQMQQ